MGFTPAVERILAIAKQEAALHCDFIDTRHVLRAMILEGKNYGGRVLTQSGFNADMILASGGPTRSEFEKSKKRKKK